MELALAACCLLGALFGQGAAPQPVRLGYSREGRPIEGYSLGSGPASAVIVGGIYGRPELNSSDLVWQLLEYFDSDLAAAPPGLRLVFVPEANPDGLADGTRELADGVDANRNFPTHDWRLATYAPGKWLADGGGDGPLSEPETVALANLIQRIHPVAVLSYHSAAGIAMGGQAADRTGMLAAYADKQRLPGPSVRSLPIPSLATSPSGATILAFRRSRSS